MFVFLSHHMIGMYGIKYIVTSLKKHIFWIKIHVCLNCYPENMYGASPAATCRPRFWLTAFPHLITERWIDHGAVVSAAAAFALAAPLGNAWGTVKEEAGGETWEMLGELSSKKSEEMGVDHLITHS